MKRSVTFTAVALLALAAWGSQAEAGGFHIGIGSGYGGYGNYGGGYYNRGYYGGGYGGGYGGYGYPSAQRWHDTSHFDYHPGGFARHYNHYHYIPGHYHFHPSGHVDTYHGGPFGGHVHHGY